MRNSMSEIYDGLPEVVKRLFVNTDCTLTEVDEIENKPWAVGTFIHNGIAHYAAIEIKKDAPNDKVKTTYHEFGHMLDWGYGECYRSESEIFMGIYEVERDDFTVDYNYEYYVSDPTEYFAQAFAEYMTNPDRLLDNTPMTYKYIEHVLRLTEIEEKLYAKQMVRNRKIRIVAEKIMTLDDDDASSWEKFKLVIQYNWHTEETLRGKLKSVSKIIFGR